MLYFANDNSWLKVKTGSRGHTIHRPYRPELQTWCHYHSHQSSICKGVCKGDCFSDNYTDWGDGRAGWWVATSNEMEEKNKNISVRWRNTHFFCSTINCRWQDLRNQCISLLMGMGFLITLVSYTATGLNFSLPESCSYGPWSNMDVKGLFNLEENNISLRDVVAFISGWISYSHVDVTSLFLACRLRWLLEIAVRDYSTLMISYHHQFNALD